MTGNTDKATKEYRIEKTNCLFKKYFPKNHSRRLAALLLVTAVGITSLQPVFASRKSQAQDAKQAAESNLNSVNNSINNITGKQQELQKKSTHWMRNW